MGRELQKKKNKSSVPRARRKPKSKKKILSNPIIAANWNQKETLSQNYRRLGLASRLNDPTGGIDKTPATSKTSDGDEPNKTFSISAMSTQPATVPEVRVERDPTTGDIVRVLEDATENQNPLNDPLTSLDDNDVRELSGFAHVPAAFGLETAVVRDLQNQAQNGARKPPRKQSAREVEWIARLVEKHGNNFRAMFHDVKLNPLQQSEGDIKRRVEKWKASQQN